jgi:hypothetical protein
MNVTYIGSLAERKLKFLSTVTVESTDNSDLFNSVSLYMPRSFASSNIVGFNPSIVTAMKPAILALTVDNYKDEAKGDLLAQITPMFRDDTNVDLTLFVIVFYDLDAVPTVWEKGTDYISFAPLTKAFQGLYFLSNIKLLYDPDYNGEDVTVPGTYATAKLSFTNGASVAKTLAAGAYTFNDGTKDWTFTLSDDVTLAAGDALANVAARATTVGIASLTTSAHPAYGAFTPLLDSLTTVTVTEVVQGTAASTRVSNYFNMALAMAYLAKGNIKLSKYWAIVKLAWAKIDDDAGTDTNKCKIRFKSLEDDMAGIASIASGDTAAYFYGALRLMGASNTFVAVDCESRNVMALILYEWFAARNSSGEYVGNKLSLIRMSSQKCFGPISNINSQFNAGDTKGYATFDSKNVGCLVPISGSKDGDSLLSMCRGVTGTPINALMIAKYCDYRSSQDCADMISDKGTLTNPVLTNEEAYSKIQNIVIGNLLKFSGAKANARITNIVANFPDFSVAKVGLTALEAASSWSAVYIDDLDTITVSGGITAE